MTYSSESLFKVLGPDRMPCNGGTGQWPEPGERRRVRGTIVPCKRGLHLCRPRDIPARFRPHQGHELWSITRVGRTRIDADEQVITNSAVLGERITTLTPRALRLYAADCAEHVLHLYERTHPGDTRLRDAITAARAYANAADESQEMRAAALAAYVGSERFSAASYAARAAVGAVYVDGADAYAADDAGLSSARAARAYDAGAGGAERAWQTERILFYLNGGAA